jgi:hypothetical protein
MLLKYWDQAFLTATCLINLLPSKVICYDTPIQRLLHEIPDYSSLRIFGCACWPNLRPYNSRKLAFRSIRCVFLGYSSLHKGFKCLDISTGRIYISRDVVFDENCFPFADLHPNAGAQLRQEILLLPSHLCNPRDVRCHVPHITNPTNDPGDSNDVQEFDATDLEHNSKRYHCMVVSPAAEDPGAGSHGDTVGFYPAAHRGVYPRW